jgi:hypothetical protein
MATRAPRSDPHIFFRLARASVTWLRGWASLRRDSPPAQPACPVVGPPARGQAQLREPGLDANASLAEFSFTIVWQGYGKDTVTVQSRVKLRQCCAHASKGDPSATLAM